jgi:hypothetical protein
MFEFYPFLRRRTLKRTLKTPPFSQFLSDLSCTGCHSSVEEWNTRARIPKQAVPQPACMSKGAGLNKRLKSISLVRVIQDIGDFEINHVLKVLYWPLMMF